METSNGVIVVKRDRKRPTGKKIENLLKKIRVTELKIKNERELELVVWGTICGRWSDVIRFRKEIGGRLCDMDVGGVALEIKYLKNISDKDRCVGQVLDYLKSASEVVIAAVDPKNYLQGVFVDDDRVFVIQI